MNTRLTCLALIACLLCMAGCCGLSSLPGMDGTDTLTFRSPAVAGKEPPVTYEARYAGPQARGLPAAQALPPSRAYPQAMPPAAQAGDVLTVEPCE